MRLIDKIRHEANAAIRVIKAFPHKIREYDWRDAPWDLLMFIDKVIYKVVKNTIKAVVDLINNIESVVILTLAGMGIAHFIGEVAITHEFLAFLLVSELISPVIAVIVIWALLRLAQWRRNYAIHYNPA